MTEHEQQPKRVSWQRRFHAKLSHMSLLTMVSFVILAACGIAGVGYLLYERDSNRKYDIARPGELQENEVLTVEDEEADTTSPVTPTATKQKIENLEKELSGLEGISSFAPEDLSDQNLQLTPPDQPSL